MKRFIRDITSLGYIDYHDFNFYKWVVVLLLNARKQLQHDHIDNMA